MRLSGSSAAWLTTRPSILPPNFMARSVIFVAFCCSYISTNILEIIPWAKSHIEVCQVGCQVLDLCGILLFQCLQLTLRSSHQDYLVRLLQEIF